MASATEYAEALLLNYLLNNESVTRPTSWYVGLHTADPGEDATNAEISGNAYARTTLTFSSADQPSTGIASCSNTGDVTFPTATGGAWGTISHISIWDADTGGNALVKGALTASKTVSDGDTFQIQTGNLVITLD